MFRVLPSGIRRVFLSGIDEAENHWRRYSPELVTSKQSGQVKIGTSHYATLFQRIVYPEVTCLKSRR